MLILLIAILSLPVYAGGDFFASASFGYTHYQAKDLNDVMIALERQSAEAAGLNRYHVDNFNGHPRQAFALGYDFGKYRIALEGESWVEDFHQDLVPFYMNRDLDPRFPAGTYVGCHELRDPSFQPIDGGTAGCIDAQEVFTLVPLTLQFSRHWDFLNGKLIFGSGIAAGVLAGNAQITVSTDFIGENARPDDTLSITLDPGINWTGKVFGEAEWKPFRHFSLSLRGSLRTLKMGEIRVNEKSGDSFLFGLVLGQESEISEGSAAYLLQGKNESVLILRDSPNKTELRQAQLSGATYRLVEGDFSGWILEAKMNFWWGNPWLKK